MFGMDVKRPHYKTSGRLLLIPPEDIRQSPDQTRREFAYDKLLELAVSIGENGLLQPISICFENGFPVLVAGERRLRAAKMAKMREIPCLEVTATGADRAVLTLVENIQRQDMNPFEEAEGIQRLVEVYGLKQEDAAYRLGYTQPTVANKLRLLKLHPDHRRQMIAAGLTERHARALLKVETPELRQEILDRIVARKLTVTQTERLIEEVLNRRANPPSPRTMIVKDIRLFLNTVDNAVSTMLRCGISAETEKNETEQYIEYVVRIPKSELKGEPSRRLPPKAG